MSQPEPHEQRHLSICIKSGKMVTGSHFLRFHADCVEYTRVVVFLFAFYIQKGIAPVRVDACAYARNDSDNSCDQSKNTWYSANLVLHIAFCIDTALLPYHSIQPIGIVNVSWTNRSLRTSADRGTVPMIRLFRLYKWNLSKKMKSKFRIQAKTWL